MDTRGGVNRASTSRRAAALRSRRPNSRAWVASTAIVAGPSASPGYASRVRLRLMRMRVSVSCVIRESSGAAREKIGTVVPSCSMTAVTAVSSASPGSTVAANSTWRPMKRAGSWISTAGPGPRPAPT